MLNVRYCHFDERVLTLAEAKLYMSNLYGTLFDIYTAHVDHNQIAYRN